MGWGDPPCGDSPLCAPRARGVRGSAPQLPGFRETPAPRPREEGEAARCPRAVPGAGTGGWAPGGRGWGWRASRRRGGRRRHGGAARGWERRVATAKGLTRVPAGARRRAHRQGTQASGGLLGAPPPLRSAPSVAGKRLGGPGPASPLSPSRRGPSPACRPRVAQAAAGASLVRAGAGRARRVCRAPRSEWEDKGVGGRAGAGGRPGCGRGQRGSCRSRIMSLTRNAPSPAPTPEQGKLLSGEGGG